MTYVVKYSLVFVALGALGVPGVRGPSSPAIGVVGHRRGVRRGDPDRGADGAQRAHGGRDEQRGADRRTH
jgi:hypothetical protein